ncbi:glycosyltransferase involved in cell wall biosynthesis [Paraburkholderia sp. GAS41]|uniref:glycosyltransferase family 2 protein n=1 Tax=Paraburkholderia sp. GAS41 TaxID=3035134 RepID=UPI003D20DA93
MNGAPRLSVIVPTYRRPADLARCLAALEAQLRPADEVIVVARPDDAATHALLHERLRGAGSDALRVAPVGQPGVVAAYNCGLDNAQGDIVCFTDDDAAPHPDWTQRLIDGFAQHRDAGGIGGRDIVHEKGTILAGARERVGLVQWYGRPIGNHHIGCGEPRPVQVLKGVNMAFRREAVEGLRFDERLRGTGAQVHCEMQFSLDVVKRGWALIYDPSILVEHYPAPRGDEDQRFIFNHAAFYNASFNLRLIMRDHLSLPGRCAFVVYATLIGTRADPGLARALTLSIGSAGPALALRKWWIGIRAMRGAWQEAKR